MTAPHRHAAFTYSAGRACVATACGELQDAGIDPSPFRRQELVLLRMLLPVGTMTETRDLVPIASTTRHGLQTLVARTLGVLEPQGFTILARKETGYGLVRLGSPP